MDHNTRLRVATRIHFALLRHLGDTVDVGDILNRESQTREVLWVCEGSGDDELMSLARQFREVQAAEHLAAMRAQAPVLSAPLVIPVPPGSENSGWSPDSSGFGSSRPQDLGGPAPASKGFKPLRWLRGR